MATSLQSLLYQAAQSDTQTGLTYYSLGQDTPHVISYRAFRIGALARSAVIRQIKGFKERHPILLHFPDSHEDFLAWFWAILLADAIPVPSTPLSHDNGLRRAYLEHLSVLLESPICITAPECETSFREIGDGMTVVDIASLQAQIEFEDHFGLDRGVEQNSVRDIVPDSQNGAVAGDMDDIAMLMLTSGSTGNAKAVPLTHGQLIASVAGKASVRDIFSSGSSNGDKDAPFLSWIGLDHVAALVEIHLQALFLRCDQIHVQAADVAASPARFLDLLSRHRVARSFATNSFLARLVAAVPLSTAVGGADSIAVERRWDLSRLAFLGSGGEANGVDTCVKVSELLARYGARRDAVVPGFGMTETCAGAIYNVECPVYDAERGLAFASLGRCMRGIEMRVTEAVAAVGAETDARDQTAAVLTVPPSVVGSLEVRGDVVFTGYYRNEAATKAAFTADGWFRTGDQAMIDDDGRLHLIGRIKDVININGVKHSAGDVQTVVERALGARARRVVCFATRGELASTEQVTVAFVPIRDADDGEEAMVEATAEMCDLIVQACVTCTGSRPMVFPLQAESRLPLTTLGKISRPKLSKLLESGAFKEDVAAHELALSAIRSKKLSLPFGEAEDVLLQDMARAGILPEEGVEIGRDTVFFDLGFTSMDLIRFKRQVDRRLHTNVPVVTFLSNPTIRSLAASLSSTSPTAVTTPHTTYDPVVVFRAPIEDNQQTTKQPLWLVHPGIGEVLVFVELIKHLDPNRPILALRARGFEPGQIPFSSIAECVDTYLSAIRHHQPRSSGPYALAGYSYGAMLAFELVKRLEHDGSEVRFLGSFNLPPHIKTRMWQLNWNLCLLNLSHFLSLLDESQADSLESRCLFGDLSKQDALAQLMQAADKTRLVELGLDEASLAHWADVAFGLQGMAVDYEPSGRVRGGMDVFHAVPLRAVATSREEWVEGRLGRWRDFVVGEVRFHQVEGAHYTMLAREHVVGFSRTLEAAMEARGV